MKQGEKQNIKKNASYYLTLTVVGWVDIFTRKELRDLIVESLNYCSINKGLNVYAFCIMTNHLHLIANTNEPYHLKDTIRDFKRHTSSSIFNWIQNNAESRKSWLLPFFLDAGSKDPKSKNIKIWQTGNHAIELFSQKFTWEKVQYIHNNPVKAGFVVKPEDWLYSSARNYEGMESVLSKVHCLAPPVNT